MVTDSLTTVFTGPLPPRRRRRARVAPGRPYCPSLVQLATEVVTANTETFLRAADRELWARLPPRILIDIYERLSSQNCLTIDTWNLLSTNLFADGAEVKRSVYHHTARVAPPPMDGHAHSRTFAAHLGPAWSPSLDYITHLTLDSTCELEKEYLMMLPDMRNLGLLRIVEPRDPAPSRPQITDRVIRGWCEKDDPFPVLRVLQLSCCLEVTPMCLRYLSRFPSLVYFSIRGSTRSWDGTDASAPRYGWRFPEDTDALQVLMLRYFGSCLGIQDGIPRRLGAAARLISWGDPAMLSRLLRDSPALTFRKCPAVLPWKGDIPAAAISAGWDDEKEFTMGDAGLRDDGGDEEPRAKSTDPTYIYNNPMWWLYAAIGYVIFRDRDLESAGHKVSSGRRPSSNGWVMPPLPILSVTMAGEEAPGRAGEGRRSLAKYRFVRIEAFRDVAGREEAWVLEKPWVPPAAAQDAAARSGADRRPRAGEMPLRQGKKRKMGDLLASMAGG
ncbi:uncharacterized protein DNG_04037 [Cephalotrichum gorgonifer]|uniref:Uncharacterized protein n=1 Tax=Cephalotrichum gorgonifer TaxID=2041049 RepID=A0AAE8SU56_9PEZI|nr:uncharacterized protein DNG_04037 [Cephalotrichum gorgonifer]